jgi:tetratricopeptide (TPR) repeat protein
VIDPQSAVHRTILAVDVEGFGDRRTNLHQAALREGLYRALRQAFAKAGIPWRRCHHEDRGDGVFVLARPGIPKDLFAGSLPGELVTALRQHNEARPAEEQIRLRMVLHAGEVIFDDHGATSAAVNLAFRLLDAAPLKAALAGSPGVLAVIASSWFFGEVISHSRSGGAATWRRVQVSVKETSVPAWISLPDNPYPPDEAAPRIPQNERVLPVPRQLPSTIPHFAGRAGELRRLTALLDAVTGESGAVIISAIGGTAGIGKTALALRWAHQAADQFPDGQLYVDLRGFDPSGTPMDPAEAVHGFLDAFEISPQKIPAAPAAQSALYRSLLAGRRVLVVLDNARDATQVRPLLPGSPGCLALITSRDELADLVAHEGARPLALDLLDQAEAVELLARRIGHHRVQAEMDAAAELAERCARLPLALAIVAARAAMNPDFPLDAIAEELRNEPDRLETLTTGNPDTSVRAAFSWSYQALRSPAARMLRLLGLHPGPDIYLPVAASLAAVPSAQARTLLAELTRAHLLSEYTPHRYWFHDLLRTYAAQQAASNDTTRDRHAATHRALDYYLHSAFAAERCINPGRDPIVLGTPEPGALAEQFTCDEQAWQWFINEHANLLAAIDQAVRQGLDTHAWQLPWATATFLDRRGHWNDLLTTHQTALAAAGRAGDQAAQASTHRLLSHANLLLGKPTSAFAHLEQSIVLWRDLGDPVGQATAHHGFSLACQQQGDHTRAITQAQQALDLYRAAGHHTGEANALNTLGANYLRLNDHQRALDHCRQALDLFCTLGDKVGQASTLESLGDTSDRYGHPGQAVANYQRAVALRRELGDHYLEAVALTRLGDLHHGNGSAAAADEAWHQALAILDELAHPDAAKIRAKLMDSGANRD